MIHHKLFLRKQENYIENSWAFCYNIAVYLREAIFVSFFAKVHFPKTGRREERT